MSDVQTPVKRKGGRPRGARNRVGNRTPSRTWLSDLIQQCYPREEWEARFKALPDETKFRIAASLQPRESNVKVDQTNVIRVLFDGIIPKPSIRARVIPELSERTGGNGGSDSLVEGERDRYRLVSGGTRRNEDADGL